MGTSKHAPTRVRRRARRAVVAALGLALLATGCLGGGVSVAIPARADPTETGSFRAGAARVDLTPLAGTPMAGYWIFGKVARGHWTRLYARAIYLQDAKGHPLVLVSCDLNMIPNGLADRVAELVQMRSELRHIGREQILLAATHTHHGPGNLFTPAMYNDFGSPRSGFDEELFDWMATRIAEAIHAAWSGRSAAELRVDGTPLLGVYRNRSLAAFLLNPEAGEVLQENALLPVCALGPPLVDPRACRAVDPGLHILHVARAGDPSDVIALGVFAAAHPTVLSPQTEVFSADFLGAAALLLEGGATSARLGGGLPGPCTRSHDVVAVFNGAEGDVQPDLTGRDRGEVLRLGSAVARAVCERLVETEAQAPLAGPAIAVGFERVPMDGRCFAEDGFERCTQGRPALGMPELGGAEDGRTLLHDVGLVEERRYFAREEHGVKWEPGLIEIAGVALNLMRNSVSPPDRAPLGVYRIGNGTESVALVALPGEFSTVMGRRLRQRVESAMNPAPDRIIGVGLASGFVSYVTTPEEYDRQHYEGATTYWGAAAGPWLAHRAETLAAGLPPVSSPSTSSIPPEDFAAEHDTGPERRFGPRGAWGPPYAVDDGLWELVFDPAADRPRRDYPAFCWHDTLPRLAKVGGQCRSAVPDVEIRREGANQALELDGLPQTNHGLDVVTVQVGASRVRTEWCAVWLVPPGAEDVLGDTEAVRFHVQPMRTGEPPKTSAAFVPHDVAPLGSGIFRERGAAKSLAPDEGPFLCELTDCSCG